MSAFASERTHSRIFVNTANSDYRPQNRMAPSCLLEQQPATASIKISSVVDLVDHQQYLLENGQRVKRAFSCALVPVVGDVVTYLENDASAEAQGYITDILERKATTVQLHYQGCEQLQITQPRIACYASESVDIKAMDNIDLTAATGAVKISAQQLTKTIVGSILETAKERISQAQFTQFTSTFMTRIHSKQALVTAEQDVKIDADRVNLG